MIVKNIGLEECIAMNINQETWKIIDISSLMQKKVM